jgi:hypothetical protein
VQPAHEGADTMMIEPDHETEDNNQKPLKGRPAAEAGPELY